MEMLGPYKKTTELSNKDAGSSRWCFAVRDGQEYFVKEFLEPKYPEGDITSTPEKRSKKIKKCRAFEERKTEMYRTINTASDGNAVRIVDFFRLGAKYYMVMPRIRSVKMSIEGISKLPEHTKRRICAIIAHSVAQLHKSKFVHADIKHANVMLVYSSANKLTAKIIDYDAGFFEKDPPTHPEEISGDQVYFSPEACLFVLGRGIALTCKLDVFALGILFHQYLTGELPGYDSEKYSCAGEAVAMGETLTISEDISEDIRNIICRMLSANAFERPSAEEAFQYLVKQLKYVVCHEVEGVVRDCFSFGQGEEDYAESGIVVNQESIEPQKYVGYKYDKCEPCVKSGERVRGGTIITLKYVKDAAQQKTVRYTVVHKIDGEIVEENVHEERIWVNANNELAIENGSIAPKPYVGSNYVRISTEKRNGEYVPDGTVITLEYTSPLIEERGGQKKEGFSGDLPARPGFRNMGDL